MGLSDPIWAGQDPALPEEPGASTLAILHDRLTERGRDRFLKEMREAGSYTAMLEVELSWLRTAVARSSPTYFASRKWARSKASEKGVSLKTLKAHLGL